MKKIALTGKYGKGKFALVDDDYYYLLNQWKWFLSNTGYPRRSIRGKKEKWQKQFSMHQYIIEPIGDEEVDHINGNTLDNRKSNLRNCIHKQNVHHQRGSKSSISKYKGVNWHNLGRGWWRAKIMVDGKYKHLGLFSREEDAAIAYNKAAMRYFGEFAWLNKIRRMCRENTERY